MSRAPLEIEFKFRLSPASLGALKRAGEIQKKESQTNHYFDLLPALPFAKAKIGIRIRNQDGVYFFTVKMPARSEARKKGLHVKKEYECRLPKSQALRALRNKRPLTSFKNAPAAALRNHAKPQPLNDLHRIGQIKNVRVTVKYRDGLTLELDKFTIGKEVFYEAECETKDPAADEKKIKALWKHLGIPLKPELASKLTRFLKSL